MATMRFCDECEMPLTTAEERKARLCHRCQFNRDGEAYKRLLANMRDALMHRNWLNQPLGHKREGRNG